MGFGILVFVKMKFLWGRGAQKYCESKTLRLFGAFGRLVP